MYSISDYRDCQSHGPIIAERVWTAWWQDSGLKVGDVLEHLKEMTNPHALPTGFVAHDGDAYVGSAFLIHCDPEERPHYLPWVAALWVEEDRRRSGRPQQKGPPTSVTRRATSAARQVLRTITSTAAGPSSNGASASTILRC